MKAYTTAAVALTLSLALAAPAAEAALEDDVHQATTILERFQDMPEHAIPESVLRKAKGLAILTSLKAGFIFSGQGGKGLVVARTDHGWSGPSAIGTGGAGFGFQAGAKVTEFVIILNTDEAVEAFSHGGNIAIGAGLSAAAGPVGRDIAANVMPVAAVYTYSRSQGLFAGVSLEGAVIVTRNDANYQYYGREVSPDQILSGKIKPPQGATHLIHVLDRL
ncbi:MAG TPA: YSC84-related protein [Candidatus Bathyarchaeia archaeon]|nr:YSC84-related protein [Candidatus Bathyarchaeia archaeon]